MTLDGEELRNVDHFKYHRIGDRYRCPSAETWTIACRLHGQSGENSLEYYMRVIPCQITKNNRKMTSGVGDMAPQTLRVSAKSGAVANFETSYLRNECDLVDHVICR